MQYIVRYFMVVTPWEEEIKGRTDLDSLAYTAVYEASFSGDALPKQGDIFPLDLHGEQSDHKVIAIRHEGEAVRYPVLTMGHNWRCEFANCKTAPEWWEYIRAKFEEDGTWLGHNLPGQGFKYIADLSHPGFALFDIKAVPNTPPKRLSDLK